MTTTDHFLPANGFFSRFMDRFRPEPMREERAGHPRKERLNKTKASAKYKAQTIARRMSRK